MARSAPRPLNTRKTKDMGGASERASMSGCERPELEARILELEEELSNRTRRTGPASHARHAHVAHARFEIAGHEGYITVGLFEDGMPGELFVAM